MPWTSAHLDWLKPTGILKTADGHEILQYEFRPTPDTKILSAWAKHFRNHYCRDEEIDLLIEGQNLTKQNYLLDIKFPGKEKGLGPAVRAGDFAEILVSDYFEYLLKYWVPRTRYDRKTVRNESTKGSDLMAFKFLNEGSESPQDIMAICEVKAQFSGSKAKAKLQEAIDHSVKDDIRKGESLNAIKQRLIDRRQFDEARKISRFQTPADKPYKEVYGAVALFCGSVYDEESISTSMASTHPAKDSLHLVTIKGQSFMELVHNLYEQAAHEA